MTPPGGWLPGVPLAGPAAVGMMPRLFSFSASSEPHEASPPRTFSGWWPAGVGVAIAVGLGVILILQWTGSDDRAALRLLRSPDPQKRQEGAWLAADGASPTAIAEVAGRLHNWVGRLRGPATNPPRPEGAESPASVPARSAEPPEVRESYVYALGRAGDASHVRLVMAVLRADPDAYVRGAAWLAVARLAPQSVASLLAEPAPHAEPWDRLGRAIAALEAGPTHSVDELFTWAIEGDAEQRHAASQALYRRLLPVLDSVGSWPLTAHVLEGEPWPPELVREVRQRCRRLDLAAIAAEVNALRTAAAPTRRLIGRLYSTRDRLERVLLWR